MMRVAVVVAEDETFGTFLERLLSLHDFDVRVAANAATGAGYLRDGCRVDLAVIDCEGDGRFLELLPQLHEQRPEAKVIVIGNEDRLRPLAMLGGASAFVVKEPFEVFRELTSSLKRLGFRWSTTR